MIGLVVRTITGPVSSSWVLRVLGREIVAPTAAVEVLLEKQFLPKTRVLRAVVGELMGLPADHPAVARGCVSVIAPCVLLLLFDRRILKRGFPQFGTTAEDASAVVRHMVQFALAGLSAVAADARK